MIVTIYPYKNAWQTMPTSNYQILELVTNISHNDYLVLVQPEPQCIDPTLQYNELFQWLNEQDIPYNIAYQNQWIVALAISLEQHIATLKLRWC